MKFTNYIKSEITNGMLQKKKDNLKGIKMDVPEKVRFLIDDIKTQLLLLQVSLLGEGASHNSLTYYLKAVQGNLLEYAMINGLLSYGYLIGTLIQGLLSRFIFLTH